MMNQRNGISPVRIGIAALALTTAIIHLVLAIPESLVAFYMNALVYIVLVTALFLPSLSRYRRQLRWLLMGFAALTIVLWLVLGQPYTTIGYIDKAIELLLLFLLWRDSRASSASEAEPEALR
jgi:hypothetical protein